jgi:hypothetical protein
MNPIIVVLITTCVLFILAQLIVWWIESKNIYNSPMCNHYGESKRYVHENDMWMCKECEDEFKRTTGKD